MACWWCLFRSVEAIEGDVVGRASNDVMAEGTRKQVRDS